MDTPPNLNQHAADYKEDAWKEYSLAELGNAVAFFAKRAQHRNNAMKASKDIYDAKNYLSMMRSHLAEIERQTTGNVSP